MWEIWAARDQRVNGEHNDGATVKRWINYSEGHGNEGRVSYHPHLGEVDEALLREVGRSLLDESQVGEVHAEVRDTRRVAATNTDAAHKSDGC